MIALLKLTFVFAGIVILLSRKWNLGAVLLLAAVAVGILFAYPLLETAQDVIFTVVDLPTLRLALEADNAAESRKTNRRLLRISSPETSGVFWAS